ncbi:MAG: hypothetical protein ACKPJJ_33445, partial [Planctomycetaceae bacterium]
PRTPGRGSPHQKQTNTARVRKNPCQRSAQAGKTKLQTTRIISGYERPRAIKPRPPPPHA